MVRISHLSSYFMPLFCSNKPHVVSLTLLITIATFTFFYSTSQLFLEEYDDPLMFKPNPQDYFRTALLGLFSPFLYYFIKVFLLNINNTFIIFNLILDFLFEDWFMLCIIIMLAYPQLQEPPMEETISTISHQPLDNSMEQWHIIPKQSYIFGISWALGELMICVATNLFNYQEAKGLDNEDGIDFSNKRKRSNNEQFYERNNITLAKCVGLRRLSSSISSNVYYNENEPLNQFKHNYNSINNNNNNNIDSKGLVSNDQEYQKFRHQPNKVMIDPVDNSIRFSSTDIEDGLFRMELPKPVFETRYGFKWVRYGSREGPISNLSEIKMYTELNSWTAIIYQMFQYIVLLFANILFITGQCFLLSIYFIYVRGHERLFTKIVIHFGSKPIQVFLFCLVTPITSLNFLISIFVFLYNDILEWYNSGMWSEEKALTSYGYYPHFHESESSQSLDLANSQMSIGMHNNFPNEFEDDTDDNEMWFKTRILNFFKLLIKEWRRCASHDYFIIVNVIIWGSILFIAGLLSTVKFPNLNN